MEDVVGHREKAKGLLELALRRLEHNDDQGALKYIDWAQMLLLRQTPIELELNIEKPDVEVETVMAA